MKLSIPEYLNRFPEEEDMRDYLMSSLNPKGKGLFPPEVIDVGMLKWDDEEAPWWGGPYSGNFVKYTIENFEPTTILKSEDEEILGYTRFKRYCRYSFPKWAVLLALSNELEGGDVDGYFITHTCHGDTCQRTRLTHQERIKVLKEMEGSDDLDIYYKGLEKSEKRFIEKELIGITTIENPFKIRLSGNDDCSHTGTFPTEERALEIFKIIEEDPTFDTLKQWFVFTN